MSHEVFILGAFAKFHIANISFVILIKKNQLDALISQIYFWNKTLKLYMFRSVPLSIIRSYSPYTAMVYVIKIC